MSSSRNQVLPFARSFRDLIVYQKQRALAREIFELSTGFPREELYALTDQIRRSSRSIGAQIAEAWAKRAYERHFVSKLTDSDAEQNETQHWIETAEDCGYVTTETAIRLMAACEEINRMLTSMRERAASFCQDSGRVKEDVGDENDFIG